jgi:hypothetical protein
MMRRRQLAFSLPAVALLAGCKGGLPTSPNSTIAQIAADVNDISAALVAALPALGQMLSATNQAALTKVQAIIADIQQVAVQVNSAATASATLPLVQQIQSDVNAVAAVLAVIPGIPQGVALALEAANALLPLLFSLLNVAAPPVPAAARKFAPQRMKPEEARATLKRIAAQGA